MKSDFELILEECLAQLRAGETLEECLSAHPSYAKKLRPLLETAKHIREIPVPHARPEAVSAGRERLLAGLNPDNVKNPSVSNAQLSRYTKQGRGPLPISRLGNMHPRLGFALRMVVLLIFALAATSGITINASARSLPGDKLYRIKRSWEDVRLSLTPSEQRRQRLQAQFAEERLFEIEELIQQHRTETVEFAAPLEKMSIDTWQVDGFQVHIDSLTNVIGIPEIGQMVYIRARLMNDGTLVVVQARVSGPMSSTPYPTKNPAPSVTPPPDEDREIDDAEPTSHPQKPNVTVTPTHVESSGEGEDTEEPDGETGRPTQPKPMPHQTNTLEPTRHDDDDPEPAETHIITPVPEQTRETHTSTKTHVITPTPEATDHTHETLEPSETPELTRTPVSTEQQHETPGSTEHPHETPVSTDDD
jgi:Domain of unknown function (DUF5667)